VFAAGLQGRGDPQHGVGVRADDVGDRWLAERQGAGLVEGDDLDGVRAFQRGGVAYQDAAAGGDAGADHDRGGRRQAERAGAGDHQDGDGMQQRVPAIRAGQQPAADGHQGNHQHDRHEDGADLVRQALHGGLGGLGGLDHPHDAGEHGLGADGLGLDHQAAIGVDRASGDVRAGAGIHGQALPGQHRGIDGRVALGDHAIDGDAFPGADDDVVAGADLVDGDVGLGPVAQNAGGIGTQAHQRTDGRGGLAAGAPFQPFPEQDEGDQDGRGLEIQVMRVTRDKPVPDRKPIGGGRAEGDQQVHVARQRAGGLPAGDVEAPAQPDLHGGGERPLRPGGQHQGGDDHPDQQRRRQGGGGHQVDQVGAVVRGGVGQGG